MKQASSLTWHSSRQQPQAVPGGCPSQDCRLPQDRACNPGPHPSLQRAPWPPGGWSRCPPSSISCWAVPSDHHSVLGEKPSCHTTQPSTNRPWMLMTFQNDFCESEFTLWTKTSQKVSSSSLLCFWEKVNLLSTWESLEISPGNLILLRSQEGPPGPRPPLAARAAPSPDPRQARARSLPQSPPSLSPPHGHRDLPPRPLSFSVHRPFAGCVSCSLLLPGCPPPQGSCNSTHPAGAGGDWLSQYPQPVWNVSGKGSL